MSELAVAAGATSAPADPPRPDAVKIPMTYPQPPEIPGDRLHFLFDLAGYLLGVDPTKGQKVYRRSQSAEKAFFFHLAPTDSLKFPIRHRLHPRDRYHWVVQPDGVVFGYLTDDAKADRALGDEAKERQQEAIRQRGTAFVMALRAREQRTAAALQALAARGG